MARRTFCPGRSEDTIFSVTTALLIPGAFSLSFLEIDLLKAVEKAFFCVADLGLLNRACDGATTCPSSFFLDIWKDVLHRLQLYMQDQYHRRAALPGDAVSG